MLLRSVDNLYRGVPQDLFAKWNLMVVNSYNVRALAALPDREKQIFFEEIVAKLTRYLQKEANKNEIGAYFVMIAKEYNKKSIPVSELAAAITLTRKAITEYLIEAEDLEGAHKLYSLMETSDDIADFFMSGSYYLVKGYLEETFTRISEGEKISTATLSKYFKDDFFFKK